MFSRYDTLSQETVVIGHVEEVSPTSVSVLIETEAPHGTSFANGSLQRFPRVNGFVVLPCEVGAVLAVVVWLGIDDIGSVHSGSDALALPLPRRRLRAIPLGLLRSESTDTERIHLERGALLFPSVGDPVRLPTAAESVAAVPTLHFDPEDATRSALHLGSAPMAAHIPVGVSANRIFGRHLAILGNTGSGKSCTLTHLLRESASRAAASNGSFRAIVLDLNGEYGNAFDDLAPGVPVVRYAVRAQDDIATESDAGAGHDSAKDEVKPLRVPFWMWNYREWHAFADPSGKSQAPILRQALHMLRTSGRGGLPAGVVTLVMGRRVVREFQNEQIASANTQSSLAALDRVLKSCSEVAKNADSEAGAALKALEEALKAVLQSRRGSGAGYAWKFQVAGPDLDECRQLAEAFDTAFHVLGVPDLAGDVSSVDAPVPFDAADLVELLGVIAVSSGADTAGWVAPMQDRLAIAMSDQRLVSACGYVEGETLHGWLESLLGANDDGQITVLDLSLVPSQAQQIVASVIARALLETLERHRRLGVRAPIILAVEEAHALVRRRSEAGYSDGASGMVDMCRDAFERVGREGRKFGLSLIISSQRPSELSETVLSQCNTFLIHRIVNSRDQDFVRRLVPDNLGTLLSEVASYPVRTALLVGAATEIPVLVEVERLDSRYRPDSADPDFEGAWRDGAELRLADVTSTWAPEPVAAATPDKDPWASQHGQPEDPWPPVHADDEPPF